METKFALRYSGPAVDSGVMDVYEVSANMIAFSAGPKISVTNNNGQVIQVTHATLNVVFSEKGTAGVHRFIGEALNRNGVDSVEIAAGAREVERVEQAEGRYFVSVAPSERLTDAVVKMVLHLESPAFKDGNNKWRFFDGQQSFHATIDDKEFLAKVDAGEPFRKGDVIVADVRISQAQEGVKLTAERIIVKVLEHKERPHQFHFLDSERKS